MLHIFHSHHDTAPPEVPVSITQEEIVHVPRLVYQHRHHHAEVEQVVDLHVPHHIEETVSVPKVEISFAFSWGILGEVYGDSCQ